MNAPKPRRKRHSGLAGCSGSLEPNEEMNLERKKSVNQVWRLNFILRLASGPGRVTSEGVKEPDAHCRENARAMQGSACEQEKSMDRGESWSLERKKCPNDKG